MAFPFIAAAMALNEFSPLIAELFNSDPDNVESISSKIATMACKVANTDSPMAAIQRLKEDPTLVFEFQKLMVEYEKEFERNVVQDRQNARTRDIAIANLGRPNRRADYMVFCAVFGLIFCLCCVGYYGDRLTGEAIGITSTVAGIFGACLKDVYAFEFGSSRGSKEKDFTVAGLIHKHHKKN
jgi:hypothetical protein